MPRRQAIVPIVLALALVLAGCSGVGGDGGDAVGERQNLDSSASMSDDDGPENVFQQTGATGDAGSSGDDGQATGSVPQVDPVQRSIVREGVTVVEVENFSTAQVAIVERTRELGGWVGDSDREIHRDGDVTWQTGSVVVRVPAEEYGTMQEAVATQGTVVREQTETTDVTDQLVDLEARLTNLERRRDRLREFYERANSTDELLAVEEELSAVQGEIERVEAEMSDLEERVAYSTLRVELRETGPGGSDVGIQYHERSLVGTILDSIGDVYRFGRASLVTVVAFLPWLVVAAVPVGLGRWASRKGWLPGIGRRWSLPFVGSDGGGSDGSGPEDGDGSEDAGSAGGDLEDAADHDDDPDAGRSDEE